MTVVALDIGGVLIENAGYDAFRLLLDRPLSDQGVRSLWLESPTVTAYECGQMKRGEFAVRAVEEFGLQITPDQFLAEFATWPRDFFPGAKALVASLRRRYRTGCLSNSNELHWHERYQSMFDFTLSSHLVGVAKPSPAIFEILEREAGVPREQICFFDDSQINVDAACTFGIRGFIAMGLTGLKEALGAAGIDLE